MNAQNTTLDQYAANFYQDISTRSNTASTNATTQSDRLTEAQSQRTIASELRSVGMLATHIVRTRAAWAPESYRVPLADEPRQYPAMFCDCVTIRQSRALSPGRRV